MWGPDPVHPSAEAYKAMSSSIEEEASNSEAKYTNPPKVLAGENPKRPRVDLATCRQEWVDGFSATLPRRDTISGGDSNDVALPGGRGRGRGSGKPDYCSFHWRKYGKFGRGRERPKERKITMFVRAIIFKYRRNNVPISKTNTSLTSSSSNNMFLLS
jgi:hypothetical protein